SGVYGGIVSVGMRVGVRVVAPVVLVPAGLGPTVGLAAWFATRFLFCIVDDTLVSAGAEPGGVGVVESRAIQIPTRKDAVAKRPMVKRLKELIPYPEARC